MKINAVTAEFNPFHKGHLIPLNYAKNKLNSDYCIAIMSPSFVQRGECAFFSKHFRTECALKAGYDAVLELPLLGVLSSAEIFAKSSIDIMNASKIVSSITFGSECEKSSLLENAAKATLLNTDEEKAELKKLLSEGLSYPSAIQRILINKKIITEKEAKILESPNSILSIEYIKALLQTNSDIEYHAIKRESGEYHSKELSYSAEYIRNNTDKNLKEIIPEEIYENTLDVIRNKSYLQSKDFDSMMHLALIKYFNSNVAKTDLENRIKNKLSDFVSIDSFIPEIKTKNITYTAIARRLMNILLNPDNLKYDGCKYIRVLGFRSKSSEIISELKKQANVPVIVNPSKDKEKLSKEALQEFELGIMADEIWKAALTSKSKQPSQNEYSIKYPIKIN